VIVRDGLLALPGEKQPKRLDLRIEGEVIAEVGCLGEEETEVVIDARNCLVLPGGIDPHVHFNDPGYTHREDFYHGCCAAATGGITTVIDMPCTSIPPVTDRASLKTKLDAVKARAVVDYGFFGGVSAQSYEQGYAELMSELKDDVLGFKTYFISGMESFGRLNLFQFENVLKQARNLSLPVLLHAEDHDYITNAEVTARASGNRPVDYYHSRPEVAEIMAVSSAVELAMHHSARLHIVHIGTARAAEMLNKKCVTGETAPHYLCFDRADFEDLGSSLKVAPSVKSNGNRDRLWQLLAEGVIDFVASDHAPCPELGKKTGSIWTDYAGIPGTGTMLPYLFSEGYLAGRLDLAELVRVSSSSAAATYGLTRRKGGIKVGADADLAIIDPARTWTVDGRSFLSKGKTTPFQGRTLRGKVIKTMLRGAIIYDCAQGITASPGCGMFLRRHSP